MYFPVRIGLASGLDGLREFTKVSDLFDIVNKWLALRITDFLHLYGVCVLCRGEFFSKCDSCFYSVIGQQRVGERTGKTFPGFHSYWENHFS